MHIQNETLKPNLSNAENEAFVQTDKSSLFDLSVNQNSLVVCLEVKREKNIPVKSCVFLFMHFVISPLLTLVLRLERRVHSSFLLHIVLELRLFGLQPVKFIDYKPLELLRSMWLALYIFWKTLLVACFNVFTLSRYNLSYIFIVF